MALTPHDIAKMLDHSTLQPYLTEDDIRLFVDVNGLDEGTHVVPVQISIDNAPEFTCALSSPEVTVTVVPSFLQTTPWMARGTQVHWYFLMPP